MRNGRLISLSALGGFALLACSGKHLHVGDDGSGGAHAGSGGGQAGSGGQAGATAGAAGSVAGAAGSIVPSGSGGTGGTGGAPPAPRRLTGLANRIVMFIGGSTEVNPNIIIAGPDGNLWYTDKTLTNFIWVMTTGGLSSAPDMRSLSSGGVNGIVAGPDGAVWLTSPPSITRLNVPGRDMTSYALDQNANPTHIAVGPDGSNLWFTDPGRNVVGKVSAAGVGAAYPMPTPNSGPFGITAGPDGAMWITEMDANRIARVASDGAVTEWPIPTAAASAQLITAGPDGALWFTERAASRIGRITTGGAFSEFDVPTPNSQPFGITAGPDGAVWFTESAGKAIGRLTPAGAFTEYVSAGPESMPWSITVGPDGNLWFTDESGLAFRIGRLTPESKPFNRLNLGVITVNGCPSVTGGSVDVSNLGDTPSGKLAVDLVDESPAHPLLRIGDNCSGRSLSPGEHCAIDVLLDNPDAGPLAGFTVLITIKPALGEVFSIRVTGEC